MNRGRKPHRRWAAAGLLLAALGIHAGPVEFEARYETTISGIKASGTRSLTAAPGGDWQLRSQASALWLKFLESSTVTIDDGQVRPSAYRFEHPLRERRSVDWQLDWQNRQAVESRHGTHLDLPEAVYDPLSLQLQLQLDACDESGFSAGDYALLDERSIKTYHIRPLRHETLATALGTIETLVLEQRRPGKSRYTLIWLAPEWHCLLVRMEQHDPEDDEHQRLSLQAASVDGKPLQKR